VFDLNREEFISLIKRAIELKSGIDRAKCPLIGKSIGMIFEKTLNKNKGVI
jgi:Aspartate/ornithine carbamoyltransferase, carbamoyl-P binding domain.